MKIFQSCSFSGIDEQVLKNVLVFCPTILWVKNGVKSLFWRGDVIDFKKDSWFISPGGQYLSFINRTDKNGNYFCKTLSFKKRPSDDLLAKSQKNADIACKLPKVKVDNNLLFLFEMLYSVDCEYELSLSAKEGFLDFFYTQLANFGILHLLFISNIHNSIAEKVSNYVMVEPSAEHNIETIAKVLGVSRSTLNRRLLKEGTSFKKILVDIRMTYSLTILQKNFSQIETAMAVGYKSRTRFAEQFKKQFGITPAKYIRSLNGEVS